MTVAVARDGLRVDSPGNGLWTETTLHRFSHNDGYWPSGVLVFDASGNLYGTTLEGGTGSGTGCSLRRAGCGTVFELSPAAGGGWAETLLLSFDQIDGAAPYAGLIFDGLGNLYGTTSTGGSDSTRASGTVFELSPTTGGVWTETVLHTFGYNEGSRDGLEPHGGLIFAPLATCMAQRLAAARKATVRFSSCRPTPVEAGRKPCCSILTVRTGALLTQL